jgi:hypothetical protein
VSIAHDLVDVDRRRRPGHLLGRLGSLLLGSAAQTTAAPQVGCLTRQPFHRANLVGECSCAEVVEFAPDSPLEGTGFELLVRGRGAAGRRAF